MKLGFRRRSLALALALVMSLSVLTGLSLTALAEGETTINILHTNDVHGRLFPDASNSGMLGIDLVAAIKKDTTNAILVDVGDVIHGLPLVNINQGLNAIELMLAAGYQVMAPGNHDFNHGSARLLELSGVASDAGMEIISSNVFALGSGTTFLPATAIVEVDGVKVGFFGLTDLETPTLTHPANVAALEFRALKASAESAITKLKGDGAKVIVGLAHVNHADIVKLLGELTVKPDLILEGHDHLKGAETFSGVLVAGAGQYQESLGKVSITIGEDGTVKDITAGSIEKDDVAELEVDAAVKALAEAKVAEVVELYSEVVAASDILLSSARGSDVGPAGVRNTEQPLGNLVSDAMRILGSADIAFCNGGGLRADVKAGELTKGDFNSVLPFGNYLIIKEVTPKTLFEIMEIGLQTFPAPNGRFPQISGFSVEFVASREPLDRVISITFDGKVLDKEDETTILKLATNDFLAAGGDGYTPLEGLKTVVELGSLDDILIEYIVKNLGGTIKAENAKLDGRVVELPSPWAVDEIADAVKAGLVPDGLLWRFNSATTRAEFAALAVTLFEKVKGEAIEERAKFDDSEDANVEKAAAIGVVKGYGDGRFGPEDPLTREQAATMLSRLAEALDKPLPAEAAVFTDNASIASWAISEVGQVQAADVMRGVAAGAFDPKGAYERQQSIATILRLLSVIEEAEDGDGGEYMPIAA